jgi:hypothetical protein
MKLKKLTPQSLRQSLSGCTNRRITLAALCELYGSTTVLRVWFSTQISTTFDSDLIAAMYQHQWGYKEGSPENVATSEDTLSLFHTIGVEQTDNEEYILERGVMAMVIINQPVVAPEHLKNLTCRSICSPAEFDRIVNGSAEPQWSNGAYKAELTRIRQLLKNNEK